MRKSFSEKLCEAGMVYESIDDQNEIVVRDRNTNAEVTRIAGSVLDVVRNGDSLWDQLCYKIQNSVGNTSSTRIYYGSGGMGGGGGGSTFGGGGYFV